MTEKILTKEPLNPVWLSLSEAANLGGVTKKTVRRAIQDQQLKYKIVKEKYFVELASFVLFLYSRKKLQNKLNEFGIGQYVKEWKK